MKENTESNFFVGLRDTVDARRNILESSKIMIKILQDWEKIRELRQTKQNEINKLKSIIRIISQHTASLKVELPKLKEEGIPAEFRKRMDNPKKRHLKIEQKKEMPAEPVDRLEKELLDIEKELQSLI